MDEKKKKKNKTFCTLLNEKKLANCIFFVVCAAILSINWLLFCTVISFFFPSPLSTSPGSVVQPCNIAPISLYNSRLYYYDFFWFFFFSFVFCRVRRAASRRWLSTYSTGSPVTGEWEGNQDLRHSSLRTPPSFTPILQLIYHFLSLVDIVGHFPRSRGPFFRREHFSFPEFLWFHPSAWHLRKQRCRSIIIPPDLHTVNVYVLPN